MTFVLQGTQPGSAMRRSVPPIQKGICPLAECKRPDPWIADAKGFRLDRTASSFESYPQEFRANARSSSIGIDLRRAEVHCRLPSRCRDSSRIGSGKSAARGWIALWNRRGPMAIATDPRTDKRTTRQPGTGTELDAWVAPRLQRRGNRDLIRESINPSARHVQCFGVRHSRT